MMSSLALHITCRITVMLIPLSPNAVTQSSHPCHPNVIRPNILSPNRLSLNRLDLDLESPGAGGYLSDGWLRSTEERRADT